VVVLSDVAYILALGAHVGRTNMPYSTPHPVYRNCLVLLWLITAHIWKELCARQPVPRQGSDTERI